MSGNAELSQINEANGSPTVRERGSGLRRSIENVGKSNSLIHDANGGVWLALMADYLHHHTVDGVMLLDSRADEHRSKGHIVPAEKNRMFPALGFCKERVDLSEDVDGGFTVTADYYDEITEFNEGNNSCLVTVRHDAMSWWIQECFARSK